MAIESVAGGLTFSPAVLGSVVRATTGTREPCLIDARTLPAHEEPPLGARLDAAGVQARETLVIVLVVGTGLCLLDQRLDGEPHKPAVLWLAVIGSRLMMIDWACHRLPTRLVTVLFLGGLAILGHTAVARGDTTALVRALLAAVIVFTAALATAVITAGALGAGDTRLWGATALFLGGEGWTQVLYGVVLALLLGAAAGAVLMVTRRIAFGDRLAFGPAIVGGALLVLVSS